MNFQEQLGKTTLRLTWMWEIFLVFENSSFHIISPAALQKKEK